MANALSTSGLVLHNLGLAAGFGGNLFGRLALNPAVKTLPDKRQRGAVIHEAWKDYGWINMVSLGAAAATWFTGRSRLSGREIDRTSRGLVIAKDVLLGTVVGSTLFNFVGGNYLGRQEERGRLPITDGSHPAPEAPPDVSAVQRAMDPVGWINLVAMAGVIAITSVLNMKAGRSFRWSALSRILP